MSPGVVLILSHPRDIHADAVHDELTKLGVAAYRVDTASLGGDVPVTAYVHGESLAGRLGDCDLADLLCAWHRRPSEFDVADPDDAAEIKAGIGGVLACLPYLNHPADMALAAFKPHQLRTAAHLGLHVPETVVTTSRPDAAALARRHGGEVVVKPLSRRVAGLVTEQGRDGWARPVHLTQQRITKTCDIRLTVVDDTMFAVRISSPYLDWRADVAGCGYQVVSPPADVARGVGRLMATLRLRYAALDFAVDCAGEWWFLELNPNGQWLWLEQATGVPISGRVAQALCRPAAPKVPPTGQHLSSPASAEATRVGQL